MTAQISSSVCSLVRCPSTLARLARRLGLHCAGHETKRRPHTLVPCCRVTSQPDQDRGAAADEPHEATRELPAATSKAQHPAEWWPASAQIYMPLAPDRAPSIPDPLPGKRPTSRQAPRERTLPPRTRALLMPGTKCAILTRPGSCIYPSVDRHHIRCRTILQ